MEYMYLKYFTQNREFPFFIEYGRHDTDMFMHYHSDFSELVIVLNGSAIHMVDNEEYFIKKGDIFVINSNTSHGYKNLNEFRICNIMFSFEYMFPNNFDIKKSVGFHSLFVIEPYLAKEQHLKNRFTLNSTDFEYVKNLTNNMISEYHSRKTGYMSLLHAQFIKLSVYLIRKYEFSELTNSNNNVLSISKPVAFIENNFHTQISIEELANQSNMSTRHFSRLFSRTYNTTPMKYIENLRMGHACSLLKNTLEPITDIAFKCGYSDSNYFSRQFKKIYSISPSQYRKNI